MDKKSIKTLIEEALKELIRRDKDLIHRKVREECINHRLACYLEQFLSEYKCRIKYSVDLEYNKNYNDPKRIQIDDKNKNTKAIRPDIIIHERENNNNNLIAFEIKKNYTDSYDLKKIRGLFRSPYNYKYGCLISYLPGKNYIKVKLLSNQGDVEEFRVYKKINKTVPAYLCI
ncbi:MAG: hypothetical protein N2V73_06840 [Candidatus Methanospirare jalkutatii]|nr:hypothetical protein [Candidatus Methanospirare jalkutatii]